MRIEYIGGPYNGRQDTVRDGEQEIRIPLSSPIHLIAKDPTLVDLLGWQPRYGIYRAEPYTFRVNKERGVIEVRRDNHGIVFTMEAWEKGGAEYYWFTSPMLFHWMGER